MIHFKVESTFKSIEIAVRILWKDHDGNSQGLPHRLRTTGERHCHDCKCWILFNGSLELAKFEFAWMLHRIIASHPTYVPWILWNILGINTVWNKNPTRLHVMNMFLRNMPYELETAPPPCNCPQNEMKSSGVVSNIFDVYPCLRKECWNFRIF